MKSVLIVVLRKITTPAPTRVVFLRRYVRPVGAAPPVAPSRPPPEARSCPHAVASCEAFDALLETGFVVEELREGAGRAPRGTSPRTSPRRRRDCSGTRPRLDGAATVGSRAGRSCGPGDRATAAVTAAVWDAAAAAGARRVAFSSTAWPGRDLLKADLCRRQLCEGLDRTLLGLRVGGRRRATVAPPFAYSGRR